MMGLVGLCAWKPAVRRVLALPAQQLSARSLQCSGPAPGLGLLPESQSAHPKVLGPEEKSRTRPPPSLRLLRSLRRLRPRRTARLLDLCWKPHISSAAGDMGATQGTPTLSCTPCLCLPTSQSPSPMALLSSGFYLPLASSSLVSWPQSLAQSDPCLMLTARKTHRSQPELPQDYESCA